MERIREPSGDGRVADDLHRDPRRASRVSGERASGSSSAAAADGVASWISRLAIAAPEIGVDDGQLVAVAHRRGACSTSACSNG